MKSPRMRRQRRRPGDKSNFERGYSIEITNKESLGSSPYNPVRFNYRPGRRLTGMKLKTSTRWIHDFSTACCRDFEVPYIDKGGKDSIFPLARWNCHPMQLVGSLASTKFSRIMRILRQRFTWKDAKAYRELALSVAIVSVITQSNWILDRFLGISRDLKKKKILKTFVLGCVRRLDDIQRFVYSQAFDQAYWLTSRSERPRDKSKGSIGTSYEDLQILEDPPMECPCKRYSCFYGSILNGFYRGGNLAGYHSDTQSEDW